jgi:hypothetical protein
MHRRPSLTEALAVISKLAHLNEDCEETLIAYNNMKTEGKEFDAARMVVDIVDHYYHVLESKGIVNG